MTLTTTKGLVELESRHSVDDTVTRLLDALQEKAVKVFAVIDHSGRPGTGTTEVKTIHRIEESVVRNEILKAGFRLAAEADFMRNKGDARDWNPSPADAGEKRGTSDRFVLKFVKPK